MRITREWRLAVDALMTVGLVLCMSYSLIGRAVHEWVGLATIGLFVTHLAINFRFFKTSRNAKKNKLSLTMNVLGRVLIFIVLGLCVSSVMLSRHALDFLPIEGQGTMAMTPHQICSYWGFMLMGLHLGLHWKGLSKQLGKKLHLEKYARILSAVGLAMAAAGAFCFVLSDSVLFMTMQIRAAQTFQAKALASNLAANLSQFALWIALGTVLKKWCIR